MKTNGKIIGILMVLLLLLTGCDVENKACKACFDENELLFDVNEKQRTGYIYFIKGITAYAEGDDLKDSAVFYYELSNIEYDNEEYTKSISACVSSRDIHKSSNAAFQQGASYFREANKTLDSKTRKLIEAYIEAAELMIDLNWKMYEACEHYESAARRYLNEDFESGKNEVDKGNIKIKEHDALVLEYNKVIGKFRVLEEIAFS